MRGFIETLIFFSLAFIGIKLELAEGYKNLARSLGQTVNDTIQYADSAVNMNAEVQIPIEGIEGMTINGTTSGIKVPLDQADGVATDVQEKVEEVVAAGQDTIQTMGNPNGEDTNNNQNMQNQDVIAKSVKSGARSLGLGQLPLVSSLLGGAGGGNLLGGLG